MEVDGFLNLGGDPMRRMLQMMTAALVCVGFLSVAGAQESGPAPAHYKRGLLEAHAKDLAATVITPHLEAPITPGRNVLWCSSFQLVWNEAAKVVGEDLHFDKEPPMVAVLNRRTATVKDIDEASCVALAGWLKEGIVERIAGEIKKKFKSRADARLFRQVCENIPPGEDGFLAYAYLVKELDFATPFENIKEQLIFGRSAVESFGIWEVRRAGKREKQVSVLHFSANEGRRMQYIVELKTTSAEDRLILACVAPGRTLAETIVKVQGLIEKSEPSELDLLDRLVVPKLNFDLWRCYHELMGLRLISANPRANGLPVAVAKQRIRFQLNEKGVKLHSEAAFGIWGDGPRLLVFDRPFLILMQRKDATTPYFALWVDNPELLVPVPKGSNVLINLPFDEAGDFAEGLARVRIGGADGGKWGYINREGKWVARPRFADARDFHEGLAAVAVVEATPPRTVALPDGVSVVELDAQDIRKCGYIDRTGKVVIPLDYTDVGSFRDGVALVRVGGKRSGSWLSAADNRRGLWSSGDPDALEYLDGKPVKGGKWDFLDNKGRLLGDRLFDEVRQFSEGLAAVKLNGKWGFMDKAGRMVAWPKYLDVEPFSGGRAAVNVKPQRSSGPWASDTWCPGIRSHTGEGLWGFIDTAGRVVCEPRFECIWSYSEGLACVRVNRKWGYIDLGDNFVIEPTYEDAGPFREGKARVKTGDRYGFINTTGKTVVKPKYDNADDYASGLACVKRGDKTGFVDARGKLLLLDTCRDWDCDRTAPAVIIMTPKYDRGYINRRGKLVITGDYTETYPFSEGLARVMVRTKDGEKIGFIDKKGRVVIEPVYKWARSFSEGVAPVKTDDDTWGYINRTGKLVIRARFESAEVWSEGFGLVSVRAVINGNEEISLYGFIDRQGRWLCEPQFTEAQSFHQGRAVVRTDRDFGFIDKTGGRIVIESRLEYAESFSEDLAAVIIRGKLGFIDRTGRVVIEPVYERGRSFSDGVAPVMNDDGEWGYIDRTGRYVVEPQYEDAEPFSEGLAAVKIDGKSGYIDRTGRMVIKPVFDWTSGFWDSGFNEGRAIIEVMSCVRYIDRKGRFIGAKHYDRAASFSEGLAGVVVPRDSTFVNVNGRVRNLGLVRSAGTFSEGLCCIWTFNGIGYIDRDGKWAIRPRPDLEDGGEFAEGLIPVRADGRWGYINRKGEWVIPAQFDAAGSFKDGFARVGIRTSIGRTRYGFIRPDGSFLKIPQE